MLYLYISHIRYIPGILGVSSGRVQYLTESTVRIPFRVSRQPTPPTYRELSTSKHPILLNPAPEISTLPYAPTTFPPCTTASSTSAEPRLLFCGAGFASKPRHDIIFGGRAELADDTHGSMSDHRGRGSRG